FCDAPEPAPAAKESFVDESHLATALLTSAPKIDCRAADELAYQHGLYAQFGFAQAAKPHTYMERYAPEIYTG
ncbi:MAG TPA: hypothetical protein VFS24_00925, partial [Steroidobacteraceae bacterium]|nr:hypothetical protein [Steroidobacteraceae bacterium]